MYSLLKYLLVTIRNFSGELLVKRKLIFTLAVRDFRSGYFGSTLGMTWIFVDPLIQVFLMWFFFAVVFKLKPSGNYPYVSWLMTSMIAWNFFCIALPSSAGTFRSYAYLLKKSEFNMSILPVVSILSSTFIHFIFIGVLVILLFITHVPFSIYWFQSVYYLFALSMLLLGLSWITASISLFIKDIKNVISVILQVGFWVSPIFWDLKSYPAAIILRLNPLTYILEGYRKSFLYREPFWTDIIGFFYFWAFTIVVLGVGMITYRKLRPFFGDVV